MIFYYHYDITKGEEMRKCGFTSARHSEHPPCHPERGSRCECDSADEAVARSTTTLVSGSDKRKFLFLSKYFPPVSFFLAQTPHAKRKKWVEPKERINVGFLPPGKSKICPFASLCSRSQRRVSAFTLAEVLITLAIIGVVAALTIPSVVKNYQQTELKTQFKKAYSIVSNTQQKIMFNLGYVPICYYKEGMSSSIRTECAAYWEEFKNTAKIAKTCKGNALQKGCIPKYNITPPSGCSYFDVERLETSSTAYILADGMIIIPYIENGDTDFLIDVNGIKGPNKGGYDLFSFATYYNETSKKSYIKRSPCGGLTAEGGRTTDEMLKWVYK